MTQVVALYEWDSEPDKKDFKQAGYKCALRRGPSRHWCGYVGIPKSHPWFGKDYSDQVKVPKEIIERPLDVDKVGAINVFCAAGKTDAMEKGFLDIVLALDVHGGLTYARDHEPSGEKDGLWWFGFDCAHAGDLSPEYDAKHLGHPEYIYRNIGYAEQECRNLADQLANVGGES